MIKHRRLQRASLRSLLLAFVLVQTATAASGASGEPLHCRIDRLIDSARVGPPSAPANDAEFLRRISLDLTGMPPSVDELKEFLADKTADKRARKIDRLLAGPLFARHWATTLDVMLMERRPAVSVSADEWQNYLLAAAQSNRPLNQVMSELLSASGTDAKNRAPARFFLDRGSEPNLITRDVGRIFFGRDMQCAQCHNHPLVKDYLQSDYYGLLAFISPGYAVTRKEGKKDVAFHAEKAGTDLPYDSVFVKNDKHVTGPRLPGGIELAEPAFPPGEEYQVKPADGVVSVPKHSRRAVLASLATSGSNRAFNENIANRLWAVMMGRGLVQPVDLHHPSNPPSYPQVLKVLTDEIAASNFNARNFLRELALTKVYQQAIDSPAEPAALSGSSPQSTRRKGESRRARSRRRSRPQRIPERRQGLVQERGIPSPAPRRARQGSGQARRIREEERSRPQRRRHGAGADRRQARDGKSPRRGRSPAQDVTKRLPNDKEVVAAAALFAKRSAAAPGELTALEKALAEKTAAVKKAGDELSAAAGAILAARARVGRSVIPFAKKRRSPWPLVARWPRPACSPK